MFFPGWGRLCEIEISDNTNISINNIPEIKYSVLSSPHIGDAKYKIYLIKYQTATKIILHKMNESIDYNTMFVGYCW